MSREIEIFPEKLNYQRGDGYIQYSYKWWRPSHFALAFFVILWDGFLVFWHTTAWSQGEVLMMVFAILHTLVGIGLTYFLIAQIFNRTDVVIDQEYLDIHNYPIPWTGNRSIPVEDIGQLFVKDSKNIQNGKVNYTHSLYALLPGGKKQQLISREGDKEIINFLEKEIEIVLNIEDKKIE
jgi:hypothetical protein